MNKKPRLILYLLINIVLSAGITLAVLWAWDHFNPQPEETPLINIPNANSNESSQHPDNVNADPEPPIEPSLEFIMDDIDVTIHIIVGAGDLDIEYVEIHNQSKGPIDMTGWQLIDENDHIFTFPALILNSDGAIIVLSKKGMNSVIELYWQADIPMWQSGETANLLNADGDIIASYSIP